MITNKQLSRLFQLLIFGAASFLLLSTSHVASAQETRIWVDSSGQFKIEAAYEKFENKNVFLRLTDGQLKQIPYTMLCPADQERVLKLSAPAQPDESPDEPQAKPPTEVTAAPETYAPSPAETMIDPGATAVAKIEDTEPEDLKPPKPIIDIGQNIGDLRIRSIEPPPATKGKRANPKYLLSVERSDLAVLPREFQGAALLLLNEPNEPREAVRALEYLKAKWPKNRQPNLIKLIINCASSDHKYNRETALEILSNRDSDQSFPYIFARVDDTSFTIRSMAYQLLRQVGDRRAIEPLTKRFASDDVDRISSLLRSFGADCEVPMLPYLQHEDPDIRMKACNLIGKVGTAKSLPALEEMAGREKTMQLKAQTKGAIKKIKRRLETGSQ